MYLFFLILLFICNFYNFFFKENKTYVSPVRLLI